MTLKVNNPSINRLVTWMDMELELGEETTSEKMWKVLVGYYLEWLEGGYGEGAFYASKETHVTKFFHEPPQLLP